VVWIPVSTRASRGHCLARHRPRPPDAPAPPRSSCLAVEARSPAACQTDGPAAFLNPLTVPLARSHDVLRWSNLIWHCACTTSAVQAFCIHTSDIRTAMAVSEPDEVASLERILTRLALTDEDKLEKVCISMHKPQPVAHGRSRAQRRSHSCLDPSCHAVRRMERDGGATHACTPGPVQAAAHRHQHAVHASRQEQG
jgi:hypothetical protein